MKLYFKDNRDRDFYAAYRKVLREPGMKACYLSRSQLIERTLMGGAPRFYITYELARRNIRRLMQHKSIPCRNALKREMYDDLMRLTLDYMERHRHHGKDFNEALMTVLSEYPAPRFYMSPKSAYNLLSQIEQRRRRLQRSHH